MKYPPFYFARAGVFGPNDVRLRAPELAPLSEKKVAVFGLGCVGAPSALEFARAGVAELRILDHDYVDPATIARWPVGLAASGMAKVEVIRSIIVRDYPYTRVVGHVQRLGMARLTSGGTSDLRVVEAMTDGVSLIFDATAEWGVQHFLSDFARDAGIPYISVEGMFGGWSGKIFRFMPGRDQGCWVCYKHALDKGLIPQPPADEREDVQQPGCGDLTFTGASFDLVEVALTAVRIAVSTLCAGLEGGYPAADWDAMNLAFRDKNGKLVATRCEIYQVPKLCRRCKST